MQQQPRSAVTRADDGARRRPRLQPHPLDAGTARQPHTPRRGPRDQGVVVEDDPEAGRSRLGGDHGRVEGGVGGPLGVATRRTRGAGVAPGRRHR